MKCRRQGQSRFVFKPKGTFKMHVCICAGWICVSAPRSLLRGQWPADPVRSAQEESPRGVFQAADRDDVQQASLRNTSLCTLDFIFNTSIL